MRYMQLYCIKVKPRRIGLVHAMRSALGVPATAGRDVTGMEALLFGFGLGVRHALDADHVVVVSTLLAREPGPWRGARLAALWGMGHTLAFLGLGLLVVVAEVHVPGPFERGAEVLVAGLLIGFGVWHLLPSYRSSADGARGGRVVFARPVAVGLVHGLAGSAGIALIAVTTVPSRWVAVIYLCVVALGTVLGMVALTLVLSRPLAWTMRREGRVKRAVAMLAAGLGIGPGLWLLFAAFFGAARP